MTTRKRSLDVSLSSQSKKIKRELILPVELVCLILTYDIPIWKNNNKKLIYTKIKDAFSNCNYLRLLNKKTSRLFVKFLSSFHSRVFKLEYIDMVSLVERIECIKNYQGYLQLGLCSLLYPLNYTHYDRILYYILYLRNKQWVLNIDKIVVCSGRINNISSNKDSIDNLGLVISDYKEKEIISDNIVKYNFENNYNIGIKFMNITLENISPLPIYTLLNTTNELFNIRYNLDSEARLCYKNNDKWVDSRLIHRIQFMGYNSRSDNTTKMVLTLKLSLVDPYDSSFYTSIFATIHPF